jgi:hypothetical protein
MQEKADLQKMLIRPARKMESIQLIYNIKLLMTLKGQGFRQKPLRNSIMLAKRRGKVFCILFRNTCSKPELDR